MKKRPDYLIVAKGMNVFCDPIVIHARARDDDNHHIRIGFTATRKIGKAVKRNFAKRRMRCLARSLLPLWARRGWDYVFIAQKPILTKDYDGIEKNLEKALKYIAKHPQPAMAYKKYKGESRKSL